MGGGGGGTRDTGIGRDAQDADADTDLNAGSKTLRTPKTSGSKPRPRRRGGNIRVKRPRGFRNYIDILHDPEFALPPAVAEKALGTDAFPLWAGPKGWQTSVHNPTALDAILTGKPYPVRAMYVSGVNIAVTYPNTRKVLAALNSLDFLAVASHMMTPTSEVADIVLPKTTGLEEEEVSLEPSAQIVCYTNPVKAPEGEARLVWEAGGSHPACSLLVCRAAICRLLCQHQQRPGYY